MDSSQFVSMVASLILVVLALPPFASAVGWLLDIVKVHQTVLNKTTTYTTKFTTPFVFVFSFGTH
jgi:hypothetical protein